jgi:hypothetical protein
MCGYVSKFSSFNSFELLNTYPISSNCIASSGTSVESRIPLPSEVHKTKDVED